MSDKVLLDGERLDKVNEDITLIQKEKGLTFGTDAYLLASYIKPKASAKAVELGAGTGIISLLCAARNKFGRAYAVEIQKDFATLTERNIKYNGLEDKISVICDNVSNITPKMTDGEVDMVFSNPPYMRTDSGKRNEADYKYIARHEVFGGIGEFCSAAYRMLKHGGKFYCVWRPDRLSELMVAMCENRLEPKVMTFVHADTQAEPSVVLVSATKGGAAGMRVTAPILLYEDIFEVGKPRKMTRQAEKIYDTMSIDID